MLSQGYNLFYILDALYDSLYVKDIQFYPFCPILPLGTGVQVDIFFLRMVAGFSKKGVHLCKTYMDVIFSDKEEED